MKYFAPMLLVLGSAMGEVLQAPQQTPTPTYNPNAAAQARESAGWDNGYTTTTYYPAYSPPATGFGFGGGLDVGFPGIVNTALIAVLTLVGLSMLIQIISKLADTFSLKDLFGGRSLDSGSVIQMAEMAFDAIKKFEELNEK